MASTVLLFTDRPEFQETWALACERVGLRASPQAPDAAASALGPHALAIFDAQADGLDEDELLACVGLARALGALPAVALPQNGQFAALEDVLYELCQGLVASSERDVARVCAGLARRSEPEREARFEYVAVSPRGGELLAILSSGRVVLVKRPSSADDDGSDVLAIQLADDARSAEVELASGKRSRLLAVNLSALGATGEAEPQGAELPASLGDVDGVRLGQRLRALRLAAGLTQAELARRTGIHRPNIARVEAGRHTPSLETLARLAAAIGVPTTRVLAG